MKTNKETEHMKDLFKAREYTKKQTISEVREWLTVTGGYEFAVVLKEFDKKFGKVKP